MPSSLLSPPSFGDILGNVHPLQLLDCNNNLPFADVTPRGGGKAGQQGEADPPLAPWQDIGGRPWKLPNNTALPALIVEHRADGAVFGGGTVAVTARRFPGQRPTTQHLWGRRARQRRWQQQQCCQSDRRGVTVKEEEGGRGGWEGAGWQL